MVHLTWSLNIFETLLTLKIQLVASFNFTNLYSHMAIGHIFGSLVHVFGVNWFLALAKPSDGIRLIVVGKAFYWLVNKVLHAYSFRMHLLFICHYISSKWWLIEVLRSWSMVCGPLSVPFLVITLALGSRPR
jgi:hypothetical protein